MEKQAEMNEKSTPPFLEREVAALRNIHEALGSGAWRMQYNEWGEMTACLWSDTMRHMLGFASKEDFPDRFESWSDRLHPEDKGHTLQNYEETVRDYSGQKTYDVEYRLMVKDGTYHWFRARRGGFPAGRMGPLSRLTAFLSIRTRGTRPTNGCAGPCRRRNGPETSCFWSTRSSPRSAGATFLFIVSTWRRTSARKYPTATRLCTGPQAAEAAPGKSCGSCAAAWWQRSTGWRWRAFSTWTPWRNGWGSRTLSSLSISRRTETGIRPASLKRTGTPTAG